MPDTSRPEPQPPANHIWRVGAAEYDEQKRELRVGGQPRAVEAKPLHLFEILLSRAGGVVTKEDLLATVWKNRTVVEQSLTTAIGKLREALGDEGRAIVEAVRGVGYRIGLPIELRAAPEKPRLALTFQAGDPVPNRPQWRLDRPLGNSAARDVWLARHEKTGEQRVFKFADTEERLQALQREAALSRILYEALGDRPDLVRISEWNFRTRPHFLESPYGGESLPEWAAARGGLAAVPLAQRIAIVARIARTAAAAHDVGVLHRDIKSSNILVSGERENLTVCLVDFGSGRITDAAQLENITVTGLGLTVAADHDGERLSGTLRYMAPEIIAGGPPTIAADVYALGILLYQMIAGDFDRPLTVGCEADIADPLLRQDVLQAAARAQDRRLPSAVILADRLESLETRRADAQRQHDLEMRAKRLAAKLDRTRLRRPWLALAAASLTLGLVATSVSAVRALRARDEAERQSATVIALNQFLTDDLIAAADPNVSGQSDLTVAAAIRKAAARIDGSLGSTRPQVRAALHAAMATAFTHLTDYDRALVEGDRALAAVEAERRPDWAGIADVQLRITDTLAYLGRLKEAGIRLAAAEAAFAQVRPARPELAVRLWAEKGYLAADSMDLPNFLRSMQVAWSMAQHMTNLSSRSRNEILLALGDAYQMVGENAEAEAILRRLLQIENAEYGADDARSNFTAVGLANAVGHYGRPAEGVALVQKALPNLERALGPFARHTVVAKDILARLYFMQCKFDAAARLWSDVVADYERAGDPAEVHHVGAQTNLALAWMRSGQNEAAERLLRLLLDEQRGKIGPQSPQAQSVRFNLAYVLLELGRPEEVPALRRGLTADTLNMAEQETDWPGRLMFIDGRLALEQGNRSLAVALLTKAQDLLKTESSDGQIKPAVIAPLLREASLNR